MNWRRQKRQILLFLGPILIPAIVLVGQAVRVSRQDREIAEKRVAEQRRNDFERLRTQLADRLEAIKLQEIDRRLRMPEAANIAYASSDTAIAFVAPIQNDRLVLPWKTEPRPAATQTHFANYERAGQSAEFADKDFSTAGERYRGALALAHTPYEECDARLQLGRVLIKARQTGQAEAVYRSILQHCGATTDEDGIPYRLYAIQCLLNAQLASNSDRQAVLDEATRVGWRPPLQLYFLRGLLKGMSGNDIADAQRSLSAQINRTEQIVALAEDASRIMLRLAPSSSDKTKTREARGRQGAAQGNTLWLAFGDEPWLVTVTAPSFPRPPLIIAVSSQSVSPPEVRLVSAATPGSDLLGGSFMGLWAEWPQDRYKPATEILPASLYVAGLTLILSFAVFGGYLLLRDIDRDLRLAEMRSHFVDSVSHELKTPLTVIRMYAEMLVRGQTRNETTTAEYHQTIMEESERLSQLVENVLDFSKIEGDHRNYVMRPTLLADVVQSVVRNLQYPLAKDKFELGLQIDETLPAISADPLALEQAIINLLTNAMKYSGASRRIELQVKRTAGEAAIEVRDWGIGIAQEDQTRVFEKFYRIRSAATEGVTGTGLGLTMVAHIVQAHGGRVALSSAPGQGSTFAIRIPLHESEVIA